MKVRRVLVYDLSNDELDLMLNGSETLSTYDLSDAYTEVYDDDGDLTLSTEG